MDVQPRPAPPLSDDVSGGELAADGIPGDVLDIRDVLDVPKAASLLGVCRNTVYALVGRNEIPHRRLGKQIRFHRPTLVRWLSSWSLRSANERR